MTVALSTVYEATAPALVGVYVFDPVDPDGTERQFLHAEGRIETTDLDIGQHRIIGRRDPLLEYGESEVVGINLTIVIPFDDDHDDAVEWWRQRYLGRRALCYRDNRKRLVWCAIAGGLPVADDRGGSSIGLVLRRVSYSEAV